MIVCPFCGYDDLIEGVDTCDQCHQPLADVFIRAPSSGVEAALLHDLIGDLPVHPPVKLAPEATVGEALGTMVKERIGCLLVVKDDKLAGIFSERDALMKLGIDAAAAYEKPIVKYMTPNPAVVSADDKIAVALHRMDVGGYRHLPVMDGDKPVSLISIRDILRYLTEQGAPA